MRNGENILTIRQRNVEVDARVEWSGSAESASGAQRHPIASNVLQIHRCNRDLNVCQRELLPSRDDVAVESDRRIPSPYK